MKTSGIVEISTTYGLPVVLVLYFSVHVYVTHYGSVPGSQLVLLTLVLVSVSLLLQAIFTSIFTRSNQTNPRPRATVFTFFLMLMLLFFGVFQDMITSWQPIAALGRLIWLLPVSILLMLICYLAIRRSSSTFIRFRRFLLLLLSIYLILDFIKITTVDRQPAKAGRSDKTGYVSNGVPELAATGDSAVLNKQPRPSVYLIILDEYMGNEGLAEHFNYPNSTFLTFLQDQGFYVATNPHSNYFTTLFSMASMFSMEHLNDMGVLVFTNHYAYKKALRKIEDNRVCSVFQDLGYTVNNKSFFYVGGSPPGYSTGLMPDKLSLAQHQTMYYRVANALPEVLSDQFNWKYFVDRKNSLAEKNNIRMMEETLREAPGAVKKPTFTYLHLLLPHHPVIRDSLGRRLERPGGAPHRVGLEQQDTAYLQYLVYTNKIISRFINDLKRVTANNAVIMLMSDHGSKLLGRKKAESAYNTLHAIFLPRRNYERWYNGVTNVNAFPLLFQTLYGLDVPLQKDTIIPAIAP